MEASRLYRFVKDLELVAVGIPKFYIPASGKREALPFGMFAKLFPHTRPGRIVDMNSAGEVGKWNCRPRRNYDS